LYRYFTKEDMSFNMHSIIEELKRILIWITRADGLVIFSCQGVTR